MEVVPRLAYEAAALRAVRLRAAHHLPRLSALVLIGQLHGTNGSTRIPEQ